MKPLVSKPNPDAWLVVYQFNGESVTYVTLDRSSAEQFAVKQRGIVYPLFKGEMK